MFAAVGRGLSCFGVGAPSAVGGGGEETLDCENAAGPASACAVKVTAVSAHRVNRRLPSFAITSSPQRVEESPQPPPLPRDLRQPPRRRDRVTQAQLRAAVEQKGPRITSIPP